MKNQNNCVMCDHKKNPDGGWCYMFRDEPEAVCLAHTARRGMTVSELIGDLAAMKRRGEAWVRPKTPNAAHERPSTANEEKRDG